MAILALLALASLFAITFHHHEFQDQHTNDCSVCIFVRTVAYLFIVSSALVAAALLLRLSFACFAPIFNSRLFDSAFRDRAPPIFA